VRVRDRVVRKLLVLPGGLRRARELCATIDEGRAVRVLERELRDERAGAARRGGRLAPPLRALDGDLLVGGRGVEAPDHPESAHHLCAALRRRRAGRAGCDADHAPDECDSECDTCQSSIHDALLLLGLTPPFPSPYPRAATA